MSEENQDTGQEPGQQPEGSGEGGEQVVEQPAPTPITRETVLPADPTIPPEFHGKTFGEALSFYNTAVTTARGLQERLSAAPSAAAQVEDVAPVEFTADDFIEDGKFTEKLSQFLEQHHNRRVEPLSQDILQLRAKQALVQAVSERPIINQFAEESKAFLGQLDTTQLADNRTYVELENMLLRRHGSEYFAQQAANGNAPTPASGHAAGNTPEEGERTKRLSPDQKAVAAKMVAAGMIKSEEDYLKQVKEMGL